MKMNKSLAGHRKPPITGTLNNSSGNTGTWAFAAYRKDMIIKRKEIRTNLFLWYFFIL